MRKHVRPRDDAILEEHRRVGSIIEAGNGGVQVVSRSSNQVTRLRKRGGSWEST